MSERFDRWVGQITRLHLAFGTLAGSCGGGDGFVMGRFGVVAFLATAHPVGAQ